MDLPDSTCVYGRYDIETLVPSNSSTELRLRELGWTRRDFDGKTVLDIGCNSGILSLLALQLGASEVCSIDPSEDSVRTVQDLKKLHTSLRLRVELGTLETLHPVRHRADIVLFMEVLHWAIAQGSTIKEVIHRLWALTGETLFIEFPWSIEEPSIKAQTDLTEERYSSSAIFEELARAFRGIEILGFMHYFGIDTDAKRVLVRAREPRYEYAFTGSTDRCFSVHTLGERSSNYIAPVLSPDGMRLFKIFSPHSAVQRLPENLSEALMQSLSLANPEYLVPPLKLHNQFIIEVLGKRCAVFPLIARRRINLAEFAAANIGDLIRSVCALRRDLRKVELSSELLSHDALSRHPDQSGGGFERLLALHTANNATLLSMLRVGTQNYAAEATQLCHGDLQEGNVIVEVNGTVKIVDLDGLALGTAFTDGLCALLWTGASAEDFTGMISAIEAEERREITLVDAGIALLFVLHWLSAVAELASEDAKYNLARARHSLMELAKWWEQGPKTVNA